MNSANSFQAATLLFYEAKYEQALLAVDRFIALKPRSSMAFNNRALIRLQMGDFLEARNDLCTALRLNHLNYVAYFNLFSLQARDNDLRRGREALRGALSSLSLIKGRLSKDKTALARALHFSTDNLEALILLVLLEVRDHRYQQALSLLTAAKTLGDATLLLAQAEGLVTALTQDYSPQKEEALYDFLIEAAPAPSPFSGRSLELSSLSGAQLQTSLEEDLQEFNRLYRQMNVRAGGVSYLIAKSGERGEGQEESDFPLPEKQAVLAQE